MSYDFKVTCISGGNYEEVDNASGDPIGGRVLGPNDTDIVFHE